MFMTEQPIAIAARPAIAEDLFCQNCGYNLRGLTGDACPECGGSLAGVRSQVSQIPWVHRKQLGWWRAYWKTVFFVMFRQRQFAEEMARPVSYRDSQSFRWVTVGFAYLPILLANLLVMLFPIRQNEFLYALRTTWWLSISLQLGYLLFLAAATGVPTYFFHPRRVPVGQQNRAVALSYYLCAPLAFTALPMAFVLGLLFITNSPTGIVQIWLERMRIDLLCILLAIALGAGVPGAWWLGLNRLARRVLPQSAHRATLVSVAVPVICAVLFAAIVVGLPVVLLYVGLFVTRLVGSLR